MTLLVGRRGLLLALALGLAAWLAAPLSAVAQKLPAYDPKAGMLAIGKDPERPDAEIFHVGYTLKGADPAKRPVTFVFNGGPGAASIYLHIAAIGPKTIVTAGDGSFPAAPARLEENPDSWISFTDLVFIDPVGTGYSRMLPGPDGKPIRSPSARERLFFGTYPGGHMFYLRTKSRAEMTADVRGFFKAAPSGHQSASGAGEVSLGREEALAKTFETFSPADYLEQIRKTAYHLWETAENQHQSTLDFWLAAENRLMESSASAKTANPEG